MWRFRYGMRDARRSAALALARRFDENDRPLLAAVAPTGRNFQRDEARKKRIEREFFTSCQPAPSAAGTLGVVSGLLTEQRFGAQVLSGASDGHAVAYLDGTLAYVSPPLLHDARLTEDEARRLDVFGLLDRFRTGVFDEPSIAVRRVLQTGDAYERELFFAERNQTLELRIALAAERDQETGAHPQPLCLALPPT